MRQNQIVKLLLQNCSENAVSSARMPKSCDKFWHHGTCDHLYPDGFAIGCTLQMAMDLEASYFKSQMKLTLGCITIISTEVGHSWGGSGIAKHLTTVISILYIASLKHTRQKHRMITMYISIGSMYAIYGNIYYQYTPHVSIIAYVYIYIPYMDPMGYLYNYIYIYISIYSTILQH